MGHTQTQKKRTLGGGSQLTTLKDVGVTLVGFWSHQALGEDSRGASLFGKGSGPSGGRLRMGRLVGKTITKPPWGSRSPILHPAFPRQKQLPA